MRIILCLTMILSGCALNSNKNDLEKKTKSKPTIDVFNLDAEDQKILKSKNNSLMKKLNEFGFDSQLIANYHIDLGCAFYFEKTTPFKKIDRVEHVEEYVLRDYNKVLKTRNSDNKDFCDTLKRKIYLSEVNQPTIYQRTFIVKYIPIEKSDDWNITWTHEKFNPVRIKKNLNRTSENDPVYLQGIGEGNDYFVDFGCSKYSIPNKIDGKVEYILSNYSREVSYYGILDEYMKIELSKDVLRVSESINYCQDRLIYNKIK